MQDLPLARGWSESHRSDLARHTSLAEYTRDPRGKVPDTKMVFNGIKQAGQLADLVAYLKQATK